jgi:hypothetical protein
MLCDHEVKVNEDVLNSISVYSDFYFYCNFILQNMITKVNEDVLNSISKYDALMKVLVTN